MLGRQEWEECFPASAEEQGVYKGERIPLERYPFFQNVGGLDVPFLLAEIWKAVFQMLHSCNA